MMKKTKAQKGKKALSTWDWKTLIASWRYFEECESVEATAFPARIVKRFFTGDYEEEDCLRIARQFAEVDHYDGEGDWTDDDPLLSGDKRVWCKFYAFCKAYCNGFTRLVLKNSNCQETEGFYCEYTKEWYRVDAYLSKPNEEIVCN